MFRKTVCSLLALTLLLPVPSVSAAAREGGNRRRYVQTEEPGFQDPEPVWSEWAALDADSHVRAVIADPTLEKIAPHVWDGGRSALDPDNGGDAIMYFCKDCGAIKIRPITGNGELQARAVGGGFVCAKPGDDVTFTVQIAPDAEDVSFRWYRDWAETPISGETGASLTVKAGKEDAEYQCEVRGTLNGKAVGETVTFRLRVDDVSYVWSEDFSECTAFVGDGSGMRETAKSNKKEIPGGCEIPGLTVYTAAFNSKRFYGQTVEVPVPPAGHKWDEGEITLEPTCSAEGAKLYRCEAKDCGCMVSIALPADPSAHVFRVTVAEPTCTEGGYTLHACTKCRYGYTDNETAPLGHSWGDWVLTTPPTEESAGEETRVCGTCGETETRPVEWVDSGLRVLTPTVVTVTVEPFAPAELQVQAAVDLGSVHYQWYQIGEGELVPLIPAEEAGPAFRFPSVEKAVECCCLVSDDFGSSIPVTFCLRVRTGITMSVSSDAVYVAKGGDVTLDPGVTVEEGYTVSYDWSVFLIGTITSDRTGATLTLTDVQTKGIYRCTATDQYGNNVTAAFYVIPVTEPMYIWSEDKTEVTGVAPDAQGGIIKETVATSVSVIAPADCVTEGSAVFTAVFTNSCFETLTEKGVLPALGHDYVAEVVAPTCKAGGYTVYTCARCSDSYTGDETPADENNHVWGEWTLTAPATQEAPGEEKRVCAACGAEETRPVKWAPVALPGDVDGDGSVTAGDARLALRRAVELETFAEGSPAFAACDIDKSGMVTAGDARIILRIAVELESAEDYR